jgi:hypothetical protein
MIPPYERLQACVERARTDFPHATALVALWTPASDASDVCVEVWTDDRARVVPMTPHGVAR